MIGRARHELAEHGAQRAVGAAERVAVARLARREHGCARFEHPLERRALVRQMRLAHFEKLRDLVVSLRKQRVEVVPSSRRFLGRCDEPVVSGHEREHDDHDRTEHEKPE